MAKDKHFVVCLLYYIDGMWQFMISGAGQPDHARCFYICLQHKHSMSPMRGGVIVRRDDDFQWQTNDTTDIGFEDLYEENEADLDEYDDVPRQSGAGRPNYRFNSKDDTRYARRTARSGLPFPPWLIGAVVALFAAFICIGVFGFNDRPTQGDDSKDDAMINQRVDETMANMTNEEKVAQLFFVTPEQLTGADVVTVAGAETQSALGAYPVGGIVYSSQNVQSEQQLKDLLSTTASYSKYPLFLGTAEIGGPYTAIASTGLVGSAVPTDTPQTVGATGDSDNAYNLGHIMGSYLANLGFNVNFGVRGDMSAGNEKSFGTDPTLVSDMVRKEISGLSGTGVKSVIQFFPGEGVFAGDPDETLTSTDRTLNQLKSNELLPFMAGIDSGAEFVMVTDGCFPAITGQNSPAVLSPAILRDLLRDDLGFTGIIISCPMDTPTLTSMYSSADMSVAFIVCGGDMIYRPADFAASYSAVLTAVNNGTISQERLDDAVRHILYVKYSS